MSEMFTGDQLADFCEKFVGRPYWYGTCVYTCTASRYASKKKQYPSHYKDNRTSKYKQHIDAKEVCSDCVGMIKGFMWTNGGETVFEAIGTGSKIKSTYGGNGCPDKSANGMFTYAKKQGCAWGEISSIPEKRGIAVRYDGHVGVYVGGGYVVEERGFNYGCVRTKLAGRPWKHWYELPFIDYGKPSHSTKPETGAPTLRKGDKGDAVREMQELLIKAGCKLEKYGPDGDFGGETLDALKAYQTANALDPDGVCGPLTWAALKGEPGSTNSTNGTGTSANGNGNDAPEVVTDKPTLHKGDKGDAVREMQELLIKAGCKLEKYGPDGDFGDETRAALKAYQTANALDPDGVCGPLTWAALKAV